MPALRHTLARRRPLLAAGVVLCGLVGAGAVVLATRSSSPAAPLFVPAVLGDQPPGATVLAREDGLLAVALALRERAGGLLLVATVLGQDGAGARGLDVSFRVEASDGTTLELPGRPATAGYYEAGGPPAARPLRVALTIAGRGASGTPLSFVLPRAWPAPSATLLLRGAEQTYRGLRTLVTHERLSSRPGNTLTSVYRAQAPHTLQIVSDNGARSVVMGGRRWDKVGAGPWRESPVTSPVVAIRPFWSGITTNVTLLGSATVGGRLASVVSFAAPQLPAFFTVWIDKATRRTLRLRMTAAAHFMEHRYGPFDRPLAIRPPLPS